MKMLAKSFDWMSTGGAGIAAVFLAGITLIMVAEIIGRFVFNSPIHGTYEVVTISMGVLFPIGFAFAVVQGRHIRVTSFTERLSPKGQSIMLLVSYILAFTVTGMMAHKAVQAAIKSVVVGEVITGGVYRFSSAPGKIVFAYAVILFCMAFLIQIIYSVRKLR